MKAGKRTILAIMSLVFSVFSIVCLFLLLPALGIVIEIWGIEVMLGRLWVGFAVLPLAGFVLGAVFGYAAHMEIQKGKEQLPGLEKKAVAGISLGVVGIAISLLVVFPIARRTVSSIRKEVCMKNIRVISGMIQMYAEDYGGYFPGSFDQLKAGGYPVVEDIASCPVGVVGYALNTTATKDCPPGTPLVGDFDSSNHSDMGGNIGYVDGSIRWYPGIYSAGSGPLENVYPEDWARQ